MCRPFTFVPIEKLFTVVAIEKNAFHCFSAPTLTARRQLKRVARMKGLARVPGVIDGQQLGARAGERLEEKRKRIQVCTHQPDPSPGP